MLPYHAILLRLSVALISGAANGVIVCMEHYE